VRCARNSERRTRRCRSCIKSRDLYKRLRSCGGTLSAAVQLWGLDPFEGTLFLLPLPFCPNRFILGEFKIYFHYIPILNKDFNPFSLL